MPKVSTFVYCENTQVTPLPTGQKMSIENPLQFFAPLFIPGNFSFSIVFGILEIDMTINHTIQILFKSNIDDIVLTDTGIINLPSKEKNDVEESLPIETKGFTMNMDFRNVVFRNPGEYHTEIILDNQHLGTFPIYVIQGSEPQ